MIFFRNLLIYFNIRQFFYYFADIIKTEILADVEKFD